MKRLCLAIAFVISLSAFLCSCSEDNNEERFFPNYVLSGGHIDSLLDDMQSGVETRLEHNFPTSGLSTLSPEARYDGDVINDVFGTNTHAEYKETKYNEDGVLVRVYYIDNEHFVQVDVKTERIICFNLPAPKSGSTVDDAEKSAEAIRNFFLINYPEIEFDKFVNTYDSDYTNGTRQMYFKRYENGYEVGSAKATFKNGAIINAKVFYDPDMPIPPDYDDSVLISAGLERLKEQGVSENELNGIMNFEIVGRRIAFDRSERRYTIRYSLYGSLNAEDAEKNKQYDIAIPYGELIAPEPIELLVEGTTFKNIGFTVPGEEYLPTSRSYYRDPEFNNTNSKRRFEINGKEYAAHYSTHEKYTNGITIVRYVNDIYNVCVDAETDEIYSINNNQSIYYPIEGASFINEDEALELAKKFAEQYASVTDFEQYRTSVDLYEYKDSDQDDTYELYNVRFSRAVGDVRVGEIYVDITTDGSLWSYHRNKRLYTEKLFTLAKPYEDIRYAIKNELIPIFDEVEGVTRVKYDYSKAEPVFIKELNAYALRFGIQVSLYKNEFIADLDYVYLYHIYDYE